MINILGLLLLPVLFAFYPQKLAARQSAPPKPIETKINEKNILDTIKVLSAYPNRHYLGINGILAAHEIKRRWKRPLSNLGLGSVMLFEHRDFPQPSVWAMIPGRSEKHIVLGAHLDTINAHDHSPSAPSPGADDNASGVAVLTEILRAFAAMETTPKHTIHFIAYAAEEPGMKGSMEIAGIFRRKNKSVEAVLNFDGTNYKGSPDVDMVLLRDHTDPKLNKALAKIIERRLEASWAYDQCQHICSDHYSWSIYGFPASFPFESRIQEENPYIHTVRDTLDASNGNAKHAALFARLGLYFLEENAL